MKCQIRGPLIAVALSLVACASFENVPSQLFQKDSNVKKQEGTPPSYWVESEGDPLHRRSQADYHFTLGETYSNEGQSEKAIEEFRHTLVYDPNSPLVYFRLAKEYVRLGLISEAIEQAEKAVNLDSKSLEQRFLLGALYSSMKMYEKARGQYDEVLKIDSKNADAQLYIGALLAEEGRFDDSAKYFENLSKNPKFNTPFLAWYYIGRIRLQQNTDKSIDQAEKALQKCLTLKSDFPDAALALASIYQAKHKEQKAIDLLASFQDKHGPNAAIAETLAPLLINQEKYDQAYQQLEIASEADPEDLNIVLKMSHILFSQKKYDAAISQLEKLLNKVPDSDKVRYFLAAVYMEKGNLEYAIKNFMQVPVASNLYFQSVILAAHSYRQAGKSSKALEVLHDALEVRKDIPQFYTSLASLHNEEKNYKEAMKVVKEGAERFPNNTEIRFMLGTLYDKLGNVDETLVEMNKVLEINPDHAQALNYVAYTYAEQHKMLDQAEMMARRATEIEPEDGYIMDTLGWILFKQGKIRESITTLESAFKLKSDESIIAEHLGDAYFKNQMTGKAKEMYKRALEFEKNADQVAKIKSKLFAIENQSEKSRRPASSVPAKK